MGKALSRQFALAGILEVAEVAAPYLLANSDSAVGYIGRSRGWLATSDDPNPLRHPYPLLVGRHLHSMGSPGGDGR